LKDTPLSAGRVCEKLATSQNLTVALKRLLEGKIASKSNSRVGEKAFARDQVLEVRWVEGRLHVAEKRDTTTGGILRITPP
jgi:hypothetical protein